MKKKGNDNLLEYLNSDEHKRFVDKYILKRVPKRINPKVSLENSKPKKGILKDPKNVEYIKSVIAQNSGNLKNAFKIIAEELNVAPGTIQEYWYKKLRDKIGTCFFIVSSNGQTLINTKNKWK